MVRTKRRVEPSASNSSASGPTFRNRVSQKVVGIGLWGKGVLLPIPYTLCNL